MNTPESIFEAPARAYVPESTSGKDNASVSPYSFRWNKDDLEDTAAKLILSEVNRHALIPLFLAAIYAMDEKDEMLLSVATLTRLSVAILRKWDSLRHPCKHFLSPESVHVLSVVDSIWPAGIEYIYRNTKENFPATYKLI